MGGADDATFVDPGHTLEDFADQVLVVCPSCGGRAEVIAQPPNGHLADPGPGQRMFVPRRLSCLHCGHTEDWQGRVVLLGNVVDPWFHQPLWLQHPVGERVVWAWNGRHLDLLDGYVRATTRRRATTTHATLITKLPRWIKLAANRDRVTHALDALRRRLDD